MKMPRSPKHTHLLITLALTAAIALLLFLFLNTHLLFDYLLAINAVTFLTYAYDKHAARKQHPRTPENTLHGLALLGGSPAALLAQQTLRHKTQKRSFQLVYWGIVIIQTAATLFWIMYG